MYQSTRVIIILNPGMREISWVTLIISTIKRCQNNQQSNLKKKKVTNFDIIHHELRGDPLEGTNESYQTVKKKKGFRKIPHSRKNKNNFWLG